MSIRTEPSQRHPGTPRGLAAAIVFAVLAAATMAGAPARAQQVAVMVNGEPITIYDIEQRMKFTTLATHKTPTRQAVIEDLIDEKLKIQVGKRYRLEIGDNDVDNALTDMGRRMRLSGDQLIKQLAQAGIDAGTLRSRIRADLSWQQIVRGKFQQSLQIRDKDVTEKLERDKKEDTKEVGVEYVLRPILFIVPRGAPEATIDARKREAEALRTRFDGCATGLPFARALRDVAVRDQIVKTSADLAPAYRKILDDTAVGKLTPIDVIPQGVEMFALCAKRENKTDGAERRKVHDEMFAEKFQAQATRYLQELRRGAMIEVK